MNNKLNNKRFYDNKIKQTNNITKKQKHLEHHDGNFKVLLLSLIIISSSYYSVIIINH